MAEPENDTTASAASDEEDVDDLYADLDEQVAAALAAAGESGGSNARDSDPATDGEAEVPDSDANEAVDLGDGTADYSSTDEESDDGLHIVLNEDAGAPLPPPPPAGRGEGCLTEDEDGDDSGSRAKGASVNDGGWGKGKGLLERTTVPMIGQGDRGFQNVFQNDFNFFLPRNSTIFDINIEAFQLKPWRGHGIDLTDYFNFGLDEQGWRNYWLSMKQIRQGARSPANVSSGLEQESYKVLSTKVTPKAANYSGFEERNGLAKSKGRAIHVEGSVYERLPSADMCRPIQRDSDVVIQVNMMHSPSNQSTSDDCSNFNHKHVTTKSERHMKDSGSLMGRAIDKEVPDRGSLKHTGNKVYIRDSACARDRSSSSGFSDALSEESKEDIYFKRENRHSDSRHFYEETKLKDEHVKSGLYCHSSKSKHRSSESDHRSRSYTPSPADDKHCKAAKHLWRDEDPFAREGRPVELDINCKNGRRVPKSGHNKAIKEPKRQPLDDGRCDMKYGQKISSSTSGRNNYRNAVHSELYAKEYQSRLERVAQRNDGHCFNDGSNHHRALSSWRDFSEDKDAMEGFSSAKEWQKHRDDGYHSLLKSEISNVNDGQMYSERYYQEMRRVKHGCNGDDEFLYYTDYRFRRSQSPQVRGKFSNRGTCAESNDERSRYHDHLQLYPQANLKNSQRDWPAAGLTSMSSRNRCIDNKRIHNAKMVRYHYDGYHQKNKHHDSSFDAHVMPLSDLYTDTIAETGRYILPVKRKPQADLGSMNPKDLAHLSLPKGRRLVHDQSVVSDRKFHAMKLHRSSKEFDTEATFYSNDMRNNITVSKVNVDARHELRNGDNILLNDRKIKFKRRGNQLIREVVNSSEEHLSAGDDLHGSKHEDTQWNMHGQNRGYSHSGNLEWKKLIYRKRQNEEDVEIEEGELIEQDQQDIVSRGKLSRPKKVALKSVIKTMSEDDACNDGATIECDDKHILEVMAKMQKRRERFKENITSQKGEDVENKEPLAVACSTEGIRNQRPARKRRWGGDG